jgi:hypothetical protein
VQVYLSKVLKLKKKQDLDKDPKKEPKEEDEPGITIKLVNGARSSNECVTYFE